MEQGIFKNEVYPLRTSDHERKLKVVLVLISNGKNQHYSIVKNMSRLMYGQIHSKHQARHHCKRCNASFASQESFEIHKEFCRLHGTVEIEMVSKMKSLDVSRIISNDKKFRSSFKLILNVSQNPLTMI